VFLPKNVHLDACFIENGHLIFSSGKLTANKAYAIAHAEGELAEAHTHVGFACASNLGSAYATGTGKSFALTDETSAFANGRDAKTFGLQLGARIIVSDGAVGYPAQGVEVIKDIHSSVHPALAEQHSPPYVVGQTAKDSVEHAMFKQYLLDLNHLAYIGDSKSAFKLGMQTDAVLNIFFEVPNIKSKKFFLLELAHKLGHSEAAYQLGLYYLQKQAVTGESNFQCALDWFIQAVGKKTCQAEDALKKIYLLTLVTDNKKDSAFKLGTMEDDELKEVFKGSNSPKYNFLLKAYELGHKEAGYQLGEYFNNKPNATELDFKDALAWYSRALGKSDEPDVEQKMKQIEATMRHNNCIIS
jgi:TPR repeat protein